MEVAQGQLPGVIRPMRGTAGPLPTSSGSGWAHELKWDGVRAIAYVGAGRVRLLSRTDQDMTSRYPELGALATVAGSEPLVVDGEIVALSTGRPSFSLLQQRMQVLYPPPDLVAAVPAVYVVFDVISTG